MTFVAVLAELLAGGRAVGPGAHDALCVELVVPGGLTVTRPARRHGLWVGSVLGYTHRAPPDFVADIAAGLGHFFDDWAALGDSFTDGWREVQAVADEVVGFFRPAFCAFSSLGSGQEAVGVGVGFELGKYL